MKFLKYVLVVVLTVFLSACNTESTEFENKTDDDNGMVITVNHSGEELRSLEFEVKNLVPKEQASNFVESSDDSFTKKDLKQLESFYSDLNQFEGVDTKTKVKETDNGILVTISGTENVDDGESTIGHTEKGGTFKNVKEFLETQGFEEK